MRHVLLPKTIAGSTLRQVRVIYRCILAVFHVIQHDRGKVIIGDCDGEMWLAFP